MRKSFMGLRLRRLREERGLTQAALAKLLRLSASYLNQLENNQRPLSVEVLVRLKSELDVDVQMFSVDEDARLVSSLRETLAEVVPGTNVPQAEIQGLAEQMPAMAGILLDVHRRCRNAEDRLAQVLASLDGDRDSLLASMPLQPYEEVREFFYARHNHMAVLDEHAEKLYEALFSARAGPAADPASGAVSSPGARLTDRLAEHLEAVHGIVTRYRPVQAIDADVQRVFDRTRRRLELSEALETGQRAFQMAIQVARVEASDLIEEFAREPAFTSEEARALARMGFANYFAGALVLPYGRFLSDAEAVGFDIDVLARRFDVSFETVCHRLSTMQRPNARGIPFFFIRVDRAGNISKRQSAADFHFSRTGGTCPLWNVYEAFAQPGRVLVQLSSMPDGRRYLWIARTVTHTQGGFRAPRREFAVALGCDARYADRLVYAKGIDLGNPDAATPIGTGCKSCERENCAQRAFPALGRPLSINEDLRQFAPYARG